VPQYLNPTPVRSPVPRRTGLGALHHPAPSLSLPQRHGIILCLLCETVQSCCHGHNPPCVGPCLLFPLSQTAPLRSARITRLHRYYGYLRLPTATALFLASYTCPKVAAPSTPTAGPPWFPPNLYVRLDTAYDPGAVPPHSPSRERYCCLLAA
jgi:hypothetical protein